MASEPTPSLTEKINRFMIRAGPSITQLVSDPEDPKLDLWIPAEQFRGRALDPRVLQFLDNLKLAAAIGDPNRPNLLFHNLGSLEPRSLSSIFVPNGHMLLINVSGSGKTRIVLEGLLRKWGLYFVCQDDGTLIGSRDLPNALLDISNHPGFTEDLRTVSVVSEDNAFKAALQINRQVAALKLNEVMLARLVIFNQFLHSVELQQQQQQPRRDSSHYIRKWLYLQLYPESLHPEYEDVFASLASLLSGSTASDLEALKAEIIRVRDSIRQKVARQTGRSHFYIVIDEAQEAASSLRHAFMSAHNVDFRPTLREIVFQWTDLLNSSYTKRLYMSFIVTGTGVTAQHLTEAVGSASFKHRSHKFLESSATGAFDSREEQEAYVAKYVPPEVLNTDLGRKLMDRMWHWLRGRYRFTTAYLTCLIENCYYKPHQLLDWFILKTAEFDALDYDPASITETTFPLPYPVEHIKSAPAPDWKHLKGDDKSEFRSIVLKAVYEYTLKSVVSSLPGEDGASLLQFGFARIPSYQSTIQMDERLILLSCLKWANPNIACPSFYKYIAESVEIHNATDPTNGFEHYLSYYFAMAFSEFTPLCKIFDFLNDGHALCERRAKLVALKSYVRPSTNTVYYEEGVTKISPNRKTPGHILGCVSSLGRAHDRKDPRGDFERWLRFGYSEPFYFPDNSAAGDIMFVLKLESTGNAPTSYIWVAVQSKLHQGKPALPDVPHNTEGYTDRNLLYLEPGTISGAIDTTTPRRFSLYLDDENDSLDDTEPPNNDAAERKRKRNRILSAMEDLPNRATRKFAGHFSCLRVVACWPAIADLKRFVQRKPNWQDPDRTDGHPLASLNREMFVNLTKTLSPTNLLIEYEKKKRSHLLGEVHEVRLASGLRVREGEEPESQGDVLQSQVSEPGLEVDYSVQLDDQTPFESQRLYVNRSSSVPSTLVGTVSPMGMQSQNPGGTGPQLSGAVTMNATTAPSQPGSNSEIQPQPVITQSRGPVVRGKTKVRASQPAKTKPKEKRRTTYKYEKEKDVSEMRKGKEPAMASTLLPAPRKSARLASKAEAKGKTKGEPQGSDDMDVN
ncbi:hypothetical protein WG66_013388 [Moniliophthora roreri]|uniref:Uncharacterized protein n=1 Tax=Moniliophthora roreri TaxID=221103 RepID=A0A0W0GF08_MONRR|nr:hypothetical protein WG66_013388 [Moniliophthora roreri]